MKELREQLEEDLRRLRKEELYRQLRIPSGVDFSSNDYLGFSRDPGFRQEWLERLQSRLCQEAFSAPASRLLRGHTPYHEEVEQRLAAFKGSDRALLFPSGYQANVGLLTALLEPSDRVLSDRYNHASIIDGLRLSRCQKVIFPHLHLEAVRSILARPHPHGRTFLVTESLFSMEGDIAPLDEYASLAEQYGAYLIVDEAHATGVFGAERGSGLVERFGVESRCLATLSTLGKAFGLWGAFVAGPSWLVDYLVNRCRTFIFTTAVPPLLLAGVETALERIGRRPELRQRLLREAGRLRERLREKGVPGVGGEGPLVPVVLGESRRALQVAAALQERGLDVRAIRPPTVPPGTARLRISVHADHRPEEIDRLVQTLEETLSVWEAKEQ